ncbi:hypothetical protein SLS54_000753 [Diplodia seriata]
MTKEARETQIEQSILHADYGHDPNVSFEEYLYYANWTRNYEKTLSTKGRGMSSLFSVLSGKKQQVTVSGPREPVTAPPAQAQTHHDREKPEEAPPDTFGIISDYEWHHASRAARTATWGTPLAPLSVAH